MTTPLGASGRRAVPAVRRPAVVLTAALALAGCAPGSHRAVPPVTVPPATVAPVTVAPVTVPPGSATHGPFPVYDNMSFRAKPDTAGAGLLGANIVYSADLWPAGSDPAALPDRTTVQAAVSARLTRPGPLVLDVEDLPLAGPTAVINAHLGILETVLAWARAVAVGRTVGYYGYHTLSGVAPAGLAAARQLAARVDAFYPSMYTFDDDEAAWAARATAEVAEDRSLAPGKPVYLYLWPQYHDHTARQYQYLDAARWSFELRTARTLADGVVIWGPSRFAWDPSSGWWAATTSFIAGQKG